MAIRQDPNSPLIFTVGSTAALLLVVFVIGLQAWFMRDAKSARAADDNKGPPLSLVNPTLEQLAKINEFRWVDRDLQVVAIPIEDAMGQIVAHRGAFPSTHPSTMPSTRPSHAKGAIRRPLFPEYPGQEVLCRR